MKFSYFTDLASSTVEMTGYAFLEYLEFLNNYSHISAGPRDVIHVQVVFVKKYPQHSNGMFDHVIKL